MKKNRKSFIFSMLALSSMLIFTGCSSDGGSKKDAGNAKERIANNVVINDKYLIKSKNNKQGVIDKKGNQIIDYKYDLLIHETINDGFWASSNNLQGILDKTGKEIIPIKYMNVHVYFDESGYIASDSKKTYLFDRKGNIEKTYNYGLVLDYNKDTFIIGNDVTKNEFGDYKAKKYGLMNKDEKVILKLEYDTMKDITEYTKDTYETIAIYAEKDGKAGVFDLKGNVIIPMEYEAKVVNCEIGETCAGYPEVYGITYNTSTQSYRVKKNDMFGVLNKDGKTLIDIKYDEIKNDTNDYIAVKDGKTTYFDRDGKEITTVDGIQTSGFGKNGLATINNNHIFDVVCQGKIIDKEGKTKEFEEFKGKVITNLGYFDDNGNVSVTFKAENGEEAGLMNDNGKFVIEPTTGSGFYSLGGKRVDFDISSPNSPVIDFSENSLYVLHEEEKDGVSKIVKSSIYDKNGKKLLEYKGEIDYKIIGKFFTISKRTDSGFLNGLLDKEGNVIAEPIYDSIWEYDDYIVAYKGDKSYLLNKETGKVELEY